VLSVEHRRRLEYVVEAIGEIDPKAKKFDKNWKNCFLMLMNRSTARTEDLLPHIHFIVPTDRVVFGSELHRRRQLRLCVFFDALGIGEINNSVRIGVRSKNLGIKELKDLNQIRKNNLIAYLKELEGLDALGQAQKQSFKLIFTARNLEFAGLSPELFAEVLNKSREVKSSWFGFKKAAKDASGGVRAESDNATVGDVLADQNSETGKAAVAFLGPVLQATGMDMPKALAFLSNACPGELTNLLARQAVVQIPGISHLVIGPSWALAGKALWEKCQAMEKYTEQVKFMWLRDACNAHALEGLKSYIARELSAAKVNFVTETVKGTALLCDIAAPSAGTAAATGVSAAKALYDILELLFLLLKDALQIIEGNKLLKNPLALDPARLFAKAPILCCYYIVLVPTSALIAAQLSESHEYVLIQQDQQAWQAKVKRQAAHATALKEAAAEFISNSRVTLSGVEVVATDESWWGYFKRFLNGGKMF